MTDSTGSASTSATLWYVIYTRSRSEKAVADRLMKKGFEVYCPLKRVRRRWSDRWKWVEEPFFSSYVFVRASDVGREVIVSTPGVVQFVFWLGKPAVVRDQEIEQIKVWFNDFDLENIHVDHIPAGERVTMASGPLMHQEGEVVAQQGQQLFLKLTQLGMILRVDMKETRIIRQQA